MKVQVPVLVLTLGSGKHVKINETPPSTRTVKIGLKGG